MNTGDLKKFEIYGVVIEEKRIGNQAVSNCPFCHAEKKLYINPKNLLWDCKVCSKTGNFNTFLGEMAKLYKSKISYKLLRKLGVDRKLPMEAFKGLQIGWNGSRYTLPVYNFNMICQDIKTYSPKVGKLYISAGANSELYLGYNLSIKSRTDEPVYLCEGEWDTIALRFLLQKIGKKGICVGVPGANTFKDEWIEHFRGRDVRVLYDNDNAGKMGSERVLDRLKGVCRSLMFIKWPPGTPQGYDIRDLVSRMAVQKKKRKKCYKIIHQRLVTEIGSEPETKSKPLPISYRELADEYRKWLHLPNSNVLKILYGSIIANKLGGDPVWLFLVAPPGGSKSELLMSLSDSPGMKAVTSLTQHTLISGMKGHDGKDPSLLAELDKKILIIKDFTTILTMNHVVKDEIFGVLRDAYDGSTEKIFGNGLRRTYNVKFGILAGVTNTIESFSIMHASLGERFLKYRITGNWDLHSERDKIMRALGNLGKENKMRESLKLSARRYLENFKIPNILPSIPEKTSFKVIRLAQFTARLRGTVDRDHYSQTVNYKPSSEVGTRIAKQLMQLSMGIAVFLGKKFVDDEIYNLIKQVGLNSVPDRVEDVVHYLFQNEGRINTPDIAKNTRLPRTTVYRVLQDLVLLKTVNFEEEKGMRPTWALSKNMRELIKEGELYK